MTNCVKDIIYRELRSVYVGWKKQKEAVSNGEIMMLRYAMRYDSPKSLWTINRDKREIWNKNIWRTSRIRLFVGRRRHRVKYERNEVAARTRNRRWELISFLMPVLPIGTLNDRVFFTRLLLSLSNICKHVFNHFLPRRAFPVSPSVLNFPNRFAWDKCHCAWKADYYVLKRN